MLPFFRGGKHPRIGLGDGRIADGGYTGDTFKNNLMKL